MKHLKTFLIITIITWALDSKADITIGVQTNLETTTNTQLTKTPKSSDRVIDGFVMVQLQKESSLHLVLGYLSVSSATAISATASSTLVSRNPYYGVYYTFCENFCSIGLYTTQSARAVYTETLSEKWTGNAYYAKIGLHPHLSESIALDLVLAYYYAKFDSRSAATAVSSVNSFTQSVIAPMVGLNITF